MTITTTAPHCTLWRLPSSSPSPSRTLCFIVLLLYVPPPSLSWKGYIHVPRHALVYTIQQRCNLLVVAALLASTNSSGRASLNLTRLHVYVYHSGAQLRLGIPQLHRN